MHVIIVVDFIWSLLLERSKARIYGLKVAAAFAPSFVRTFVRSLVSCYNGWFLYVDGYVYNFFLVASTLYSK